MYYLARQHIKTGELGIIEEKLADVKISALLQNISGKKIWQSASKEKWRNIACCSFLFAPPWPKQQCKLTF